MQFFTYLLTSGSFSINSANGAQLVSIATSALDNGSCTVLGTIGFNGLTPVPVPLANGEGVNFTASTGKSPLDGLTVTWFAGSIKIIIGFE